MTKFKTILKTGLKLLILSVVVIEVLRVTNLFSPYNQQIKEEVPDNTSNVNLEMYREVPNVLYDDYRNSDRYLAGPRTLTEIVNRNNDVFISNYKSFPNLAGYYAPLYVIDRTDRVDIDKDGKDEDIVFYSCLGCNALSRAVDIIKENRIIFTAEGAQLQLLPLENEIGFELRTTSSSLQNRMETKLKFLMNQDKEYYVFSEEETFVH